ncbi:MAG: dihydrofolate reductase family protein [Cyclobacteriaceae bacterium]
MRKLILYIATSIEGYIARPDGDVKWLEDQDFMIEGEDFGYQKFLETIDTTLMGNSTYKEILGFGVPFPYPDKDNYVFTKSKQKDNEFVRFINSDIPAFVRNLKTQEGKDIWLIGGGKINMVMMEHGLIDQIILTVMPVCLGDGIPLFSPGSKSVKWKLSSSRPYDSGVVQLIYHQNS